MGPPLRGATSATYLLVPTTGADSGAQFAVVVSNMAGTVTSPAATLTVNNSGPGSASGSFSSPPNGASVTGTVLIDVAATAPVGVANVQITIDGNATFCSLERFVPYTCAWDSIAVPDGPHTLSAIIQDNNNTTTTVTPIFRLGIQWEGEYGHQRCGGMAGKRGECPHHEGCDFGGSAGHLGYCWRG